MRGVTEEHPATMNSPTTFQKNICLTFPTHGAINRQSVLNCQEWWFKLFEINHSALWSERTLCAWRIGIKQDNQQI